VNIVCAEKNKNCEICGILWEIKQQSCDGAACLKNAVSVLVEWSEILFVCCM